MNNTEFIGTVKVGKKVYRTTERGEWVLALLSTGGIFLGLWGAGLLVAGVEIVLRHIF